MNRLVPLACALLLGLFVWPVHADDKSKRSPEELQAMTRIQQKGGLVLELAQNDPHLDVSYQQITGKFTDDDLAPLAHLKGVVWLNLSGLNVTDASLSRIKDLTGLTRLHLEKTKITDQGLANLKGLVNLEYLNLYGTAVTDKGLANLEGMKKLKHLYLWQTKVTDAGVARLKKALPGVQIVRGFDAEPAKVASKPAPKPAAKP
ncbi:MAG TPA: hypothetical protein VFA18_23635, partial [Gemmataceae bacterium]|nr:hypothetical protein [Gemmataceae bacterium]